MLEPPKSPSTISLERRNANLNTATFDRQGVLWFTGQNGVYGRLDPQSGVIAVFDAPRGTGPYGIATTPEGQVFFASFAGNYLGRIDVNTDTTAVLEPPEPRQGARRVWSDSHGVLWITCWNSGDLFRYYIATNDVDAARQIAISTHPIGRLGLPNDIAKGIVFLGRSE